MLKSSDDILNLKVPISLVAQEHSWLPRRDISPTVSSRPGSPRTRERPPQRPAPAGDPRGRRQLPLRRRHQRHGRRDVQALTLAGLARPRSAVLVRRRQDLPRQLAARADQFRPTPQAAHRPEPASRQTCSTSSTSTSMRSSARPSICATARQRDQRKRPCAQQCCEAPPTRGAAAVDRRPAHDRRWGHRRRTSAGRKTGQGLDEAYENLRIAVKAAHAEHGDSTTPLDASSTMDSPPRLLPTTDAGNLCTGSSKPPTSSSNAAASTLIGNPPFLGGKKLTGALGREHPRLVGQHSCRAGAREGRPGGLLLPSADAASEADGHSGSIASERSPRG